MNNYHVQMLALVLVILLFTDGINTFRTAKDGHVANGADAISFPGEVQRRAAHGDSKNASIDFRVNNLIPSVDFVQKINNYNVSDLLLNFVDDYEEDSILANRFGATDVERSSAVQPKPATCMPELQTVKLVDEKDDPTVIFIPSCTRIERCGGCCSHNLLSCQPSDSELVHYKVIKTQFAPGNRLKYVGKVIVHVEKHTKCHCACRVQAKDCTAIQVYSADECACKCANPDEEKKCHTSSNNKLWDYTTCTCQCRNVQVCSSGFMYDTILCRCTSIPKRRHLIHQHPVPVAEEDKQRQMQVEQFPDQYHDEYDY